MTSRKLYVLVATIAALAPAALAPPSSAAWAPASSAKIHPGVMTHTRGAQCTSNFIYQGGSNVYIGHAAHCSGTGAATETNGCRANSRPLGTKVRVDGAQKPGTMVYNSWLTMQQKNEKDGPTCRYNDFALVKLAASDARRVNPSVPGFGGPTGVGSGVSPGDTVYSYQNSSLRGGVSKLSPKQGVVVQNEGGGWSHVVYTLTPGVPGDSGSGFMNESGRAIGTLSTLNVLPTPGGNGVGDLAKELAYMRANSSFSGLQLVPGTEPFSPDWVGAIGDA
jgi:hypothetical protein